MGERGLASGGGTGLEAPRRPCGGRVGADGPARGGSRRARARSAVAHVAWALVLGLPVLLSAQDAEQPSPYDFAQVALRAGCDPAVRAGRAVI